MTRGLQVVVDLCTLSLAYWLAFLFRFEFSIPHAYLDIALHDWGYVCGLQYAMLVVFGVPQHSWRYASLREMLRIGISIGAGSVVLLGLRLVLANVGGMHLFDIPLGVLAMNAFLGASGLVAVRATRRLQGEATDRRRRATQGSRDRVLLIGAGQAGVLVARELQSRPDLGLDAVGFLDDDPVKVGTRISGLTVLGTTQELAEVAARKHVKRALITIASAPGPEIRRIAHACADAGIETKIIPGIYEIVGDQVNLSRIRDVSIDDLLGRDPVRLDEAQVAHSIKGRVVLVTGAGGSIGSELCRQVARFEPTRIVLVERFENALFEIHRELIAMFPTLAIDACVADVCDQRRMVQVFEQSTPSVVFHAAAHKHVPMMEHNPGEALKNNVGGTKMMADLADRFGVERFVLVSTDKAVNPSSVMGATKRVAEIVCQSLAARSATRFVTVRFGNVLGSNGSVIPIFKEQIARGGPVTVTHPDMSRYFMTIPEAAQLVVQAGAMGQGGEIFILDMGTPVKIVDLARDLIKLSGFRPEDVDVVFTGIRPGEKLFEELSTSSEFADKTRHPKIFIGRIASHLWADVIAKVSALVALADTSPPEKIRSALCEIVPEYVPSMNRVVADPSVVNNAAADNAAAGTAGAENTVAEPRERPIRAVGAATTVQTS